MRLDPASDVGREFCYSPLGSHNGGGAPSMSQGYCCGAGHSHMAPHLEWRARGGVDQHGNCPLGSHVGSVAGRRDVDARVRRAGGCGEAVGRAAGSLGSGAAVSMVEEALGGAESANATKNENGCVCGDGMWWHDGQSGWGGRGGLCHPRTEGGGGLGPLGACVADKGYDVGHWLRFVEETTRGLLNYYYYLRLGEDL